MPPDDASKPPKGQTPTSKKPPAPEDSPSIIARKRKAALGAMTKTVVMPPSASSKGKGDKPALAGSPQSTFDASMPKTDPPPGGARTPFDKPKTTPLVGTGTVVIPPGGSKRADAAKAPAPKGVWSPFGAPSPNRGAANAEKTAAPPSATGQRAGTIEKTEVLSPEQARRAREQGARPSKTEPPSKLRKPPSGSAALTKTVVISGAPKRPDAAKTEHAEARRSDGPSKLRKPPLVNAAVTKTVVIPGGPRRPATKPAPAALKPPTLKPLKPQTRPPEPEAPVAQAKPKAAPAPAAPAADIHAGKSLMHGAKLRNVRLVRADLRGADLRRADLSHADLGHADLSHAKLDDADLSFANLYKTKLDGAQMDGCKRSGTRKVNPDRV